MTPDDVARRFDDEIKLRAYDDQYVDRNEEREILQIAIQMGVGVDAARAHLALVCEANGYVLESVVVKAARAGIAAAANAGGKVDRAAFEAVVADATAAVRGQKTDREVRRLVVQVMEDTGNTRVKRRWFRDWYGRMKRDLGVS